MQKKIIFLPKLSSFHSETFYWTTQRSSFRTQMALSQNVTVVHNQFSSVQSFSLVLYTIDYSFNICITLIDSCINFLGCHSKVPQGRWLKQQNLLPHSSAARCLRSRCQQSQFPVKSEKENLFYSSPLASVVCWQPLSLLGLQKHHPNCCLHLHVAFYLCVCVLISPF